MKISKLSAALIPLLFCATSSMASIIKTDVDTFGDNLAALHEETGIEWLSLSSTVGMSFHEVQLELGEGGAFDGWRVATRDEVNNLFNYLYPTLDFLSNSDYRHEFVTEGQANSSNPYDELTRPIYGAFGWAGRSTGSQKQEWMSAGFYLPNEGDDFSSDILMSGTYLKRTKNSNTDYDFQAVVFDDFSNTAYDDPNFIHHAYGTFLVSDGGVTLSSIENPELNRNNLNSPWAFAQQQATSVSEPFTAALFGISVMGLALQRASRKRR